MDHADTKRISALCQYIFLVIAAKEAPVPSRDNVTPVPTNLMPNRYVLLGQVTVVEKNAVVMKAFILPIFECPSLGSVPAASSSRAASRFLRASASPVAGYSPKDSMPALPLGRVYLKRQSFEPLAFISRNSPFPSNKLRSLLAGFAERH